MGGGVDIAGWAHQEVVLGWLKLVGVNMKNREAGATLVEVLLSVLILIICSVSIMGLVSTAIAMNQRNKVESTGTMLAQSVVEQIKATIIGSGSSSLRDCAGTLWTINTAPGGATVGGSTIDFTQSSPPSNYHMNYVVNSPCGNSGAQTRTYDVRWNVKIIGSDAIPPAPTNTYLITVGARLLGHGEGNLLYPLPVNFRVMVGN
jgi:type II secretory pathway pseudopilin PulG